MSFRQYGGINYAPKHNMVSSNYNTANNLQVTQDVGQPNSYINFESDISGNISITGVTGFFEYLTVVNDATINGLTVGQGPKGPNSFQNTVVGSDCLTRNSTGNYNSAFGRGALNSNTSGSGNSAFGNYSLNQNDTGSYNTAIGVSTLCNVFGTNNVAVGAYAGNQIYGNNNTLIGANSDSASDIERYYNSTAIGCNAQINGSDQIMLGGVNSSGVYPLVYVPGGISGSTGTFDNLTVGNLIVTGGISGFTGGSGGGPTGPTGPTGTIGPNGSTFGDYLYWDGSQWVVGDYNIKLGAYAGYINQKVGAVAIGQNAGQDSQESYAVAIGQQAGNDSQQSNAIAIGNQAGQTTQGNNAVAIGQQAGYSSQQEYAVAIGPSAGQTSQQSSAVAVGYGAGNSSQGNSAVAVGYGAGQNNQQLAAISIGYNAGVMSQGTFAVAVGFCAGFTSQQSYAVAIGYNAGNISQGSYAIAIGYKAGQTNQPNNSIMINASSNTIITGANGNAFYVNPVRNDDTNSINTLTYNTSTNEITYNKLMPLAYASGSVTISPSVAGYGSQQILNSILTVPSGYSYFMLNVTEVQATTSTQPSNVNSYMVILTDLTYEFYVYYNSPSTTSFNVSYVLWAIL